MFIKVAKYRIDSVLSNDPGTDKINNWVGLWKVLTRLKEKLRKFPETQHLWMSQVRYLMCNGCNDTDVTWGNLRCHLHSMQWLSLHNVQVVH